MRIRLWAVTTLLFFALLAGCKAEKGSLFIGPSVAGPGVVVTGGGNDGTGGVGGGTNTEATLVYEQASAGPGIFKLEVNGAGTVIVYGSNDDPLGSNPSGDEQIYAISAGTQVPVQISTDSGNGFRANGDFDIDDAGAQVVFVSSQDLTGANPGNSFNVFVAPTDGSPVSQITSLNGGFAASPRISGSGTTIVFTSESDLTGGNPMNDRQIFSILSDGSNLTQVTTGATFAEDVAFSDDGTRIVWQGLRNPFGTNADGSREIFAINIDGTNHMQLTMSSGDSFAPRISDDGSRVVFTSNAVFPPETNADNEREVYVVNGDGTGMVRITDTNQRSGAYLGGAAGAYDISGDGRWVVYTSSADLFSINTDNTHTIYWSSADGTIDQQLLREETKPAGVNSRFADQPRTNNAGDTIFFEALAPYATGATSSGDKIFAHFRQ